MASEAAPGYGISGRHRARETTADSARAVPIEGRSASALAWTIWIAALSWSAAGVLYSWNLAASAPLIAIFGWVALWRYAWGLLHLTRASVYLGVAFPRLRRRAIAHAGTMDHVYAVVSSYDIPPDQFRAVYAALIESCLDTGIPTTIVAAVTADRDIALLTELLERHGNPARLRLIAQFQAGTGKRTAMAQALRTIARAHPSANSVTLLLDGDVMVQRNAVGESVRFLAADAALAALTTNNDATLAPGDPARHWYWLRLAQRHLIMSSLSLSRRLLVLTGRFSAYRTHLLVEPACIALLERDQIEHWLHGSITFLSGDDKSLWHHVLSRGGRMLYLPHVKATAFEAMPGRSGFIGGSSRLMVRWLGNMVRANGRALGLGPLRCGPFLWWSLLDQRLAILSTLLGASIATCLLLTGHVAGVVLYLCWLFLSRSVVSGVYGLFWGYYNPAWPLLLVYNQVWGALLKLYLFFRPDKQRWTRQHISQNASTELRRTCGNLLFALSLVAVFATAATLAGTV